jgi:hypothetical protein
MKKDSQTKWDLIFQIIKKWDSWAVLSSSLRCELAVGTRQATKSKEMGLTNSLVRLL